MTDAPVRHSRRGLIVPFAIAGLILAAWTVWWFALARQVETRATGQIESLRQAGWTIDTAPLSVDGWPFRVRLNLGQARVVAPSGHGLEASRLVAEANAWAPLTWVAIAPDDLTLTRPDKGRIRIEGDGARMSLAGIDRPWPRFAMELIRPTFTPVGSAEAFPISRAEHVSLEAKPGPQNQAVDVLFQMVDARGRAGGPVEGVTDSGLLSARVELRMENAEGLRTPSDEGLMAGWSRGGGRFTHVRGLLESGDNRARIESESLSAREDGRLEGRISMSADRPAAVVAGIAGRGAGAARMAGAAGSDVALVLDFRDGRAWLGPFAVAPAPRLF
ncbi:DUF2125 domain-containing protein [Brevundimonas fluminis]|jgi:hypothetical protein|uniref:DUF2125 domain-containing protein n=1 Tax=Brevundimonas fluminis TaxID=2487274 RepID=UPI000F65744D|nr:DUF2125 domain-containing protein [Brevundimonas fluminis]